MLNAYAVTASMAALGAGVLLPAPLATADPAPVVAQAVVDARGAACEPLHYNPVVERAAEIVNRSTLTFLNHTGENVPADGQHPTAILKDLGIEASKDQSLQGAGQIDVDALRGVLIEGYRTIPDCSYTDFGASSLYDEQSGYHLVVVILVAK